MIMLKQLTPFRLCFSICVISLLSFSQPTLAFQILSGNLMIELKSIDYGDKDDNSWKQPSQITQATFSDVMDAFLAEDFSTAEVLALSIGYEIVKFKDTSSKPAQTHYILREKNPLPSALFIGGGTYVLNPAGANVAVQAPHPISDSFTGTQAIETYLTSQSRLLFLAGTRRDNSTEISQCTDGHYRKSDASHYTEQLFYIAHSRASDADPSLVFVQLHGFGSTSLTKLQNQCDTTNDKLINLSEGVNYSSDLSGNTFMQILRRKTNEDGVIQACVYGNETSSLGATWTTTGRYSNNSPDPCLDNAESSSERFIHIEQSYRVRSNYRMAIADLISAAIAEYFQTTTPKTKGHKK